MLAAGLSCALPLLTHAGTRVSGELTGSIDDTHTQMHPITREKPVLPTSKPDAALAYTSVPVSITPPTPKPSLEDIFPRSTNTINEMIRAQTGLNAVGEVQLSLRAGEGIGALLRRGGYDPKKISAAVDALSGKAQPSTPTNWHAISSF